MHFALPLFAWPHTTFSGTWNSWQIRSKPCWTGILDMVRIGGISADAVLRHVSSAMVTNIAIRK